ncbi:MAG TPA: hypothetical protein VMD53_12175 [Rhizomicrobium sp.]|nr:hypothetical protein [Rhizomicrobium sp.]
MLQSRFDELRERLLRAGIAPRHVRRYIAELRDHFDDLVREETANGASQSAAEMKARARLGSDNDLAETMLARPDLRSLMARYPWAVFGVGPVAMLIAGLAAAVAIEVGVLNLISAQMHATGWKPSPAGLRRFILAAEVWNTLATYVAPFVIAVTLCVMGLRQRMPAFWIFTGIVIACVLGGFQEVHFSDDGHHGELSLGSGLLPPFSMKMVVGGLYRAVITSAAAAALYWFGLRRQRSGNTTIDSAATLPAE